MADSYRWFKSLSTLSIGNHQLAEHLAIVKVGVIRNCI